MEIVYKLTQPGDVEGRSKNLLGCFRNSEDAELIGRSGYGSMMMPRAEGGLGVDWNSEEVSVFESFEDFANSLPEDEELKLRNMVKARLLKDAAIAKLTTEEREALGL